MIIKLFFFTLASLFYTLSFGSDLAREQENVDEINALPQYGKLTWLGEGSQRFASLYAETESSTNLGIVILLHDIGSHPDKDPLIYELRRKFPERNWGTLALQLPLRESGATDADYYELLPEATQRIVTAVQHVAKTNTQIVIVGHQLGALMGLHAAGTEIMPELKAIITIGLNVPKNESIYAQTEDLIARIQIPFLDLYSALGSTEVIATARKRRMAARKNLNYRQDKLNYSNSPYWGDHALVMKRSYSWLTRVSKDFPVLVKEKQDN
ncbi:MAG: DUF3530 family protein [Methyloprofundus sp.]|nr:DUF3530 family protein [Methyloprofundus sp.]